MFLKIISVIYLLFDLVHFFARRISHDPNNVDFLSNLVFESIEVSLTRYILLIAVIISTNNTVSCKIEHVVSFLLFLTFDYFTWSNMMFHLTRGSLLYELYFTELIGLAALISVLSSSQEESEVRWGCLGVPVFIFVIIVLLFETEVFSHVMV